MMHSPRRSLSILSACLAVAGLVAGCGGSGGGDASTPAPVTTTTLSGAVVKGPVNGANVCAFKAIATGKGEQIKCVTTSSTGTYSLDITYTGDVVIEASGGTYTDEATGTTKTLGDPMQVVVASQGGATVGVITPLTAVAYNTARGLNGGVTSVNFATASNSVAGQFQLTGVNLATTTPVVAGTTNNYGNILRAVSQYVANGNTLASVLSLASPQALQAGFAAAYAKINGSTLTFTFNGGTSIGTGTGTGTGAGTGTGSGTSTGTGTGATAGTSKLTIVVNVSGTSSTVVLNNVPKPTTQAEFCGELTKPNSQLNQFTQSGGSLTINSCSFSGNTGQVSATVTITSPVALTVPYTVTYTYN